MLALFVALAFSQMQKSRLCQRTQGLVSALNHEVRPVLQRPYVYRREKQQFGVRHRHVGGAVAVVRRPSQMANNFRRKGLMVLRVSSVTITRSKPWTPGLS